MLWCQTDLDYTHVVTYHQTVAVMVVLCDLCGDEVYCESLRVRGAEQLPISVATSSSVVGFE